jgi:hypothetical protein
MAHATPALALLGTTPQRLAAVGTAWIAAALLALPATASLAPYSVALGGSGLDLVNLVSDIDLDVDGTVSVGGSLLAPAGPEGVGDGGSTTSTLQPGDSFAARLSGPPAN